MAKRKRSSRAPQPRHRKKGNRSQHDKLKRLRQRNPERTSTTQAKVPLTGQFAGLVIEMIKHVDARVRFRLPIIIAGMLLSSGRRTASSWLRAAGVGQDWDRFYDTLNHLGWASKHVSWSLLMIAVRILRLDQQSVIRIAIDDSPTKRYGRHVEGAGVHHNPTPGPADGKWIYGRNWVTLALIAPHSAWGVIALPIRSLLYIRKVDIERVRRKHAWKFRTKHELAAELVTWLVQSIRHLLQPSASIQLAMDGAYASSELIRPLMRQGVTVISRLRKDAKLLSLPGQRRPGQRGRSRVYGTQQFSLAKRAGQSQGWQSITYRARKQTVTRPCKTFLATSTLVRGVMRVVIVRYEDGAWAAYFSTDPNLRAQDILEATADRWSIEESFHDTKEVWGAGQQQVRRLGASIGCWNLIGWVHTLVQLHAWDRSDDQLVDRSDRQWDNPHRRASTSDMIRAITKEMLVDKLNVVLPSKPELTKIRQATADLFLWLSS